MEEYSKTLGSLYRKLEKGWIVAASRSTRWLEGTLSSVLFRELRDAKRLPRLRTIAIADFSLSFIAIALIIFPQPCVGRVEVGSRLGFVRVLRKLQGLQDFLQGDVNAKVEIPLMKLPREASHNSFQ